MNAVTTRPFEVSLGSAASPYSLPGLHPKGFIGSRFQQPGEKRFVTTDQKGTLGTTSYSPDQVVASIGAVGALSAAMGSVPVTTLLPDESVRCGVGTGTYGGQYAGSLGCAAKVANRLFFNGGVAMTATDTVNNGAMGRLGFSFGFGGSPPKAKQAELAAIPAINGGGNSVLELGNGGQGTETTVEPVLMAKRTASTADVRSTNEEALKAQLAELKAEIEKLREATKEEELSQAYQQSLNRIESLEAEKVQLEASLQKQLKDQSKQLAAQGEEIKKQKHIISRILDVLSPTQVKKILQE